MNIQADEKHDRMRQVERRSDHSVLMYEGRNRSEISSFHPSVQRNAALNVVFVHFLPFFSVTHSNNNTPGGNRCADCFPVWEKARSWRQRVALRGASASLCLYVRPHVEAELSPNCAELLSAVQIRPAVHQLKLSSDSHRTICCDTHIFTAAFSLWGSWYNLATSTRISLFPNEAHRGPSARRQLLIF